MKRLGSLLIAIAAVEHCGLGVMGEYTLEGKPPVTLNDGDVLFIPAGTIHSARNVGAGRGRELATYIVEKGKPLIELSRFRRAK